jgi:tRNA uridine 5-carboxymethylaminomethyl modification enzyme
VAAELERLAGTVLVPSASLDDRLAAVQSSPIRKPTSLLELLRRPEIDLPSLARFGTVTGDVVVAERVEVAVKYAGYLRRQEAEAARLAKMEDVRLPEDLDYGALAALSREAREKLAAARPLSLGQAARISGITPAAVSILATIVAGKTRAADRPASKKGAVEHA